MEDKEMLEISLPILLHILVSRIESTQPLQIGDGQFKLNNPN